MCMNSIKNIILSTNTLGRALLCIFCVLFFVKLCDPLRLASNAFLYTTQNLNEVI